MGEEDKGMTGVPERIGEIFTGTDLIRHANEYGEKIL